MSQGTNRGRGLHRRRAALIVVVVVPTIICASAIRPARASFYDVQPILCYGVDDDTGASILCGLAEETTKRSSALEPRASPSAKAFCPAIFRPPVPRGDMQRLSSSIGSPVRLKRMLALRARPSGDPDDPH